MCFFNVNDEKICYGAKVFNKSLELVKFEKKWRSGTTSKIQHQWPVAWNRNGTISNQSFTHSIYFTSTIFASASVPLSLFPPLRWIKGTVRSRSLDSMAKQNLEPVYSSIKWGFLSGSLSGPTQLLGEDEKNDESLWMQFTRQAYIHSLMGCDWYTTRQTVFSPIL